jgi:hypothetical protein
MNSLVDVVGAEHSGPLFDTPLPRRGTSLATHLDGGTSLVDEVATRLIGTNGNSC